MKAKAFNKNRKKAMENNRKYKSIEEVIQTLETMKPLYNTAEYKQGWNDSIYLLRRAVRDLSL